MAKERGIFDSWRIWVTAFCWLAVFVSTVWAARRVEDFVSSDPQFVLSPDRRDSITISGLTHASRARVARVFAPDLGRSIYLMPLAERRRRLLAIDWVADASVSRIWPDRILVRVAERRPVAFVNLPRADNVRGSRLELIDEEGVFLEPPPRAHFTFPVLEGVSEKQTEGERRDRVRAMSRLLEDLRPLAQDISEVHAENVEDLRIVMQVRGRALELELGDGNYARRCQNFINHYPEIRRKTPDATSFDLRLDDRIITKD